MNPLAIPLPVAVRRHGEIAGLIAGIACFPIALYAGALDGFLPRGPAALVLPIVIMSAIVGAIASATVDPRNAPDIGGVPLRVGVRAGFVASLLGGAFAVLAATLHTFGLGAPARAEMGWDALALFLPHALAARAIVLALLALPPSIFFSLIGAMLAGMLQTPPPANADASSPQALPARERSAVFTTAIVLTIFCYLSPFFVLFKPKPKPVPVVIATPRPSTPLPAPPPPPPKWRYVKPETFSNVEPSRIVVTEQRGLGEVAQNLPVALSPDGLRFACFRRSPSRRLEVIDLETLDVIASANTGEEPAALAWSPDSRRLFFATEGERKGVVVFDASNSRLIHLPKPLDMRVPAGRPVWWDDQDVLFIGDGAAPSILYLDTLRVLPAEESEKWKALPAKRRDEISAGTTSYLPGNARWQMRVESTVRQYNIPMREPGPWMLRTSLSVALVNSQSAYRVMLASVDVLVGDDLVASPDGSKIVRIRENAATVFFLGLRAEPGIHFTVAMPAEPESSLTDALAKYRVGAFVCAPLINPLNGKTVGPDRERVKAVARIRSWEQTSAKLWIDEDYQPVQSGDVVADLHTWEAQRPQSAGVLGKSEWFAVIDAIDSKTRPPARNEASPLDRELTLVVDTKRGADRVEKIAVVRPQQPPPLPQSPEPTSIDSTAATNVSDAVLSAVLKFVRHHHAKSSASDVGGLAADFADRVEYMSHGIVGRDFIAKDLGDYHRASARITDTIISTPTTEARPDGEFDVVYLVSFRRDMPDRRWFSGVAEFSLRLKVTTGGLKITAQHIKLREQQKGP